MSWWSGVKQRGDSRLREGKGMVRGDGDKKVLVVWEGWDKW